MSTPCSHSHLPTSQYQHSILQNCTHPIGIPLRLLSPCPLSAASLCHVSLRHTRVSPPSGPSSSTTFLFNHLPLYSHLPLHHLPLHHLPLHHLPLQSPSSPVTFLYTITFLYITFLYITFLYNHLPLQSPSSPVTSLYSRLPLSNHLPLQSHPLLAPSPLLSVRWVPVLPYCGRVRSQASAALRCKGRCASGHRSRMTIRTAHRRTGGPRRRPYGEDSPRRLPSSSLAPSSSQADCVPLRALAACERSTLCPWCCTSV